MIDNNSMHKLFNIFNTKVQQNVRLSNFTTMNVGGPADALLIAYSADQLAKIVSEIWKLNLPLCILGGGSNLLISDKGFRGVVVVNHAHNIKVNTHSKPFTIWAESGALMANIGKKLIVRGLSGMEWAATIPGTVGGAVYGNAGAFGKDTSCNLISAEIIHRQSGRKTWDCNQLDYTYRASKFKRNKEDAIILSALFHVEESDSDVIQKKIDELRKRRSNIQPSGFSVGSIFRNPPNDSAGRLIEAVGLKGTMIGGAIISPKHANFIINKNNASAQDIFDLIMLAKNTIKEKYGIDLTPEIEIIGEWDNLPTFLQIKKEGGQLENE
ncbi:MAG: UDP-N-acetylmuramate dehydrogenase [Anaerolineaceae bacterium]|nr:UDP-N-acetylmuramate dehydrogenase [Anaerolineaceae bacterium]